MSNSPRIILWDLETSHNLAAVFQLKQQDYIQSENIVQERFIICASWKELGKHPIRSVSNLEDIKRFTKNPYDDYHVVKTLHLVLSGADVLVAHNGDSFDMKFAEARMLVHGFSPLPPITTIDTLKVARTRFLFNANNLNYLGGLLGVGGKKPTKTGLWLKVLRGDKQAIRDMVAYNRQDIVLLEKVFLKLQPYVANHVNRQLYGGAGCPRCGSSNTQSRGIHKALTRTYRRFQCMTCGGWFRDLIANNKSTTTRVL
jgi:hypothetical protein